MINNQMPDPIPAPGPFQYGVPMPQCYPPHAFVIPYQPAVIAHNPSQQRAQGAQHWIENLCGCFTEGSSCLLSFFCPCIQFGENQGRLNNSSGTADCIVYFLLMFCYLQWVASGSARGQLRIRFNIKGNPLGDYLVEFFCLPCALAQVARELKTRIGPEQP